MGMIDISGKKVVPREAVASGKILLSAKTMTLVKGKGIEKGDPLLVAEVAAMKAAKETFLLIPHCHQIPLHTVGLRFSLGDNFIEVNCLVKAEAKTGVEMEALVGTSVALTTIWDMVKYLEKDLDGQYPSTRITDIRVLKKTKEPISKGNAEG